MDAKNTWPVVKLILEATSLKRQDARRLLDEFPPETHAQLFLRAQRFKNAVATLAVEELAAVVGESKLSVLLEAVQRAKLPSHKQPIDGRKKLHKTPRK